MAIKKIRISNFKSFNDLEIELSNFNVLIGANASGKSNFIQIFKFLRNITNEGLENAISREGGVDYLRNINIGCSKNFSVEIVCPPTPDAQPLPILADPIYGEMYDTIYKFIIKFKKEEGKFEIEEEFIHKCKLSSKKETIDQVDAVYSNVNGDVQFNLKNLSNGISEETKRDIHSFFSAPLLKKISPETTLLSNPSFTIGFLKTIFSDISIYDFDPKLSKKAIPITGKAELEKDGSNLALVLKNVIEDKDRKRKFDNLIKYLLPFVEDLEIEKFVDKSLFLKLRESYFKNQYLPAFLLSDGTINMTALIIALYFEKKPLAIIEEPEKSIHPSLISKAVKMMKEASQKKQIIVTTHNPEMVKHANLEDVLLIARDKEGFSTISRPCEKEEIKIFLENEIGIEDLYVQNLLGI
ncbi:MAG: AAA family ATPase [bacterium]|nr:AAA family ATPase [bacterium]